MKARLPIFTLLVLVASSSLGLSEGRHGEYSPHKKANEDVIAPGTEAAGVAVINSIDTDNGTVNLTHEPMPKLGWPTMTMDLPVTKRVELGTVKKGDKVEFKLKLGRDKKYRIIDIAPEAVEVKAEPEHRQNSRHDTGHSHHRADGGKLHKTETAYGAPGDPQKPSRTVSIRMIETDDGMAFEPNRIKVKKDEQIAFQVTNTGKLDHEIVIATIAENLKHAKEMQENPDMAHHDANALRLKSGRSGSFLWKFTNAGEFDMSCLIPGHREAGMTGVVAVK